jgi:hypothetical protein
MFGTWGSVVLTAVVVLLAVWAGLRLLGPARRFGERRLGWLSAFFLLFALTQAILVLETILLIAGPPVRVREGFSLLEGLFWVRHSVFLVALLCAVAALGVPRLGRGAEDGEKAAQVVPFFLLAQPILLVLQGIGLFYLVVRAAHNHARRSDPGSLRVAIGFALLLLGHLSPFVVEPEGPAVLGIPGGGSALFVLAGTLMLLWSTGGGRSRAGEDG